MHSFNQLPEPQQYITIALNNIASSVSYSCLNPLFAPIFEEKTATSSTLSLCFQFSASLSEADSNSQQPQKQRLELPGAVFI